MLPTPTSSESMRPLRGEIEELLGLANVGLALRFRQQLQELLQGDAAAVRLGLELLHLRVAEGVGSLRQSQAEAQQAEYRIEHFARRHLCPAPNVAVPNHAPEVAELQDLEQTNPAGGESIRTGRIPEMHAAILPRQATPSLRAEIAPFELPTDRIQRHEMGQCKPCLFWFHNLCRRGQQCSFCHLRHTKAEVMAHRPRAYLRRQLAEGKLLLPKEAD